MSHDKIRAAARRRMTDTGEPYTAARRAAVRGRQAAGEDPPRGPGYWLAMSGEIRDWLAGLRTRDPAAAARVVNALATLMEKGARLGEPLVASPADSWPWALVEALDLDYQERLAGLQELRQREAEAISLVRDLQLLSAELDTLQPKLADARHVAAVERQSAEVRRLLPGMLAARQRLGEQNRRLQAQADTFRVRKEVRTASYVAASGSLRASEAMAAPGLAGDVGGQPPPDEAMAISAARARLADVTAQLEREAGQQAWPDGLMALRPGLPDGGDFCLLFAAEPPGTALLLAVLDGAGAVADRYFEAVLAAAELLRRARAGRAREAAVHGYRDPGPFVAEFYPGGAGADPGGG